DYPTITTHSFSIAARQTSTPRSRSPAVDAVYQGNETIILGLTGGTSGTGTVAVSSTQGSATGTITNDDAIGDHWIDSTGNWNLRSEERRVGKECRIRWDPDSATKTTVN